MPSCAHGGEKDGWYPLDCNGPIDGIILRSTQFGVEFLFGSLQKMVNGLHVKEGSCIRVPVVLFSNTITSKTCYK